MSNVYECVRSDCEYMAVLHEVKCKLGAMFQGSSLDVGCTMIAFASLPWLAFTLASEKGTDPQIATVIS